MPDVLEAYFLARVITNTYTDCIKRESDGRETSDEQLINHPHCRRSSTISRIVGPWWSQPRASWMFVQCHKPAVSLAIRLSWEQGGSLSQGYVHLHDDKRSRHTRDWFADRNVIIVAKRRQTLPFANCFGKLKLWRMYGRGTMQDCEDADYLTI